MESLTASKGGDIEDTKRQILKILLELLKEPDFRAHLLKLGVEASTPAIYLSAVKQ